jgi:hypothetical protein
VKDPERERESVCVCVCVGGCVCLLAAFGSGFGLWVPEFFSAIARTLSVSVSVSV